MAVKAISGVQHYTGLATDTKPTSGVPAGSVFWAVNTTDFTLSRWVYTGEEWGEDAADDGVGKMQQSLEAIQALLTQLLEVQIELLSRS